MLVVSGEWSPGMLPNTLQYTGQTPPPPPATHTHTHSIFQPEMSGVEETLL